MGVLRNVVDTADGKSDSGTAIGSHVSPRIPSVAVKGPPSAGAVPAERTQLELP
jgi:hypothetical protein